MSKILILQGHPDPNSFVAALAKTYAHGARSAGAEEVRTIDLGSLAFDPILRLGYRGEQPLEPDLVSALEAIQRADHVTFAFPTWWVAPPALVKGFIDRVFLPGIAYRYEPGKLVPKGLFAGRSARLIATMDSPSIWYWLKQRRALHNAFVVGTLEFAGFGPVAASTIYGVRKMSPRACERALQRAEQTGAQDAGKRATEHGRRLLAASASSCARET